MRRYLRYLPPIELVALVALAIAAAYCFAVAFGMPDRLEVFGR
jgi:hypothetical protein